MRSRNVLVAIVIIALGITTQKSYAAISISVMPLGDSITAGTTPGGYRLPMVTALSAAGFNVTTLGTQTDNAMPQADRLHEGHSGWRIDQLSANLIGDNEVDTTAHGGYWLTGGHGTGRLAINPNYVCMMAGINDINQYYGNATQASPMSLTANVNAMMSVLQARMTTLIDTFALTDPGTTIMLAGCIPYNNGLLDEKLSGANATNRSIWAAADGVSVNQEYGVNHYVILLDSWIKNTLVPQEKAAGKKIFYVDQYKNFILPDGSVRGWDNTEPQNTNGPAGYGDYGLHPNQFGYNLMGSTWAQSIATTVPEPACGLSIAIMAMATIRRRKGR